MEKEDLARLLAEYLRRERLDINLKNNKKDFYYDNLFINKKIYKIQESIDNATDNARIPQRPTYQTLSAQEMELARAKFMYDDTQVLSFSTPRYLSEDESVIITSITRDINSIVYVGNFTDKVKQVAILEAKRQGFVFHANTPLFMLQNSELIRLSITRDINSINFVPNDVLTSELLAYTLELAKNKNYLLSDDSPEFLMTNIEIIKQTLKLDKNAGIRIVWDALTSEQIAEIEKYIVENKLDYIMSFNSPTSFKRNVDICIISAKNDFNSVSYFDWNYFDKNDEALKRIIDALVEQNYVLDYNSPDALKSSARIGLNSIKNDIHSAKYFSSDLQYWISKDLEEIPIENEEDRGIKERLYEIRHYLIENGFYSLEEIAEFRIPLLKDETVLDYYLRKMGIPKDTNDEELKIFYDRVKDFFKKILSTSAKVSDTRKVFKMVARKKWENYRREHNDYYTNIFNRICDSLEKNNNFISSLNELKFLMQMDDVLDERKYALFNAFIEYHQLYHNSHADNKKELLRAKRDDISKYAALFISKSKEDFINEQMALFDKQYKRFFNIRLDNPIVRKKVIEIKQRDMFKKLFDSHDENLMQKLDAVKAQYLAYGYNTIISKDVIPQILELFISQIILNNVSSVDDILAESKPARFDEYENYEKVVKLINRLNSHNISYESQEVSKYRDFIVFDGQKYVYNGNGFSENELAQIMGYKDLKYVFGKIRSEIMQIVKGIDKFDKLTQEDIKSAIDECPFTDEYYQFNPELYRRFCLRYIDCYVQAFDDNKDVILNDTNYRALQQIIYANGLMHISAMTDLGYTDTQDVVFDDMRKYVSNREAANIMYSIPNLINGLLNPEEINIDNLGKLLDFKDMFKYADLKQIGILGKEVAKKIYDNDGMALASPTVRLNVACDLLSAMTTRKESTVPYISGTYRNYRYSMYDATDETLLTAGLDTNACFRCCSTDNDFLHYCALDKNGFVIKLTDSEGNFIGRASGFRNGNGIYINQLRTIYDKKASAYDSEREAIIKTFEQACNDIVEISQNNKDENDKIDFVVVTKSYILDETKSNISDKTASVIGNDPMDTESEDWKNFKKNTRNLREAANYFTTDYSNYSLICMKSAIGELTPDKIKKGDVPAVYIRKRNPITVHEPGEKIETTVNRIRAIFSHQTGKEYEYIKLPQDCEIMTGDNWYAILGNQGLIDSCYLPNDVFAQQEFNTIMEQLLMNKQSVSEIGKDISFPSL